VAAAGTHREGVPDGDLAPELSSDSCHNLVWWWYQGDLAQSPEPQIGVVVEVVTGVLVRRDKLERQLQAIRRYIRLGKFVYHPRVQ
jgi:hypothetical protein